VSGAILVTLIAQLINLVYPFPADYLAKMSGLLNLPDLKIWQVYLLIAVLPGVCEEILFRGFIIRFFESNGKWISILVSAALFALFHLDPYRFLPVLLLGILLGWLLIKSNSIYISMFSHAVNNSLALAFTNLDKLPFVNKYIVSNDQINWWMALPAGLLLCLGLYLFAQINRSQALPADQ
jgi:membrane protease YdiL (CAAX protease family)